MKKLWILALVASVTACGGNAKTDPDTPEPTTDPVKPDPTPSAVGFAKGADISWATEMEHDGRTFKKKDGKTAALLDVLKDCGVNAIRLRVWVKPYSGWSGKNDVVAVAKKVKAAGMKLMIDFHYSDFFADPGRQVIPSDWTADKDDLEKMCKHVSDHTTDILTTLKNAGVDVTWIQIGNETRDGMLFPSGSLQFSNKNKEFASYVKLSNAGYDAAKAIFPNAYVMPHQNNAFDYNNKKWWFTQFKAQGGKMDMIALSHYPQLQSNAETANAQALNTISSLAKDLKVPVMVAEIGFKTPENEATAKSLFQSFMTDVQQISDCAGVFYWEPEVDGSWKPAIYNSTTALTQYTGITQSGTWEAYKLGAFKTDGSPTSVMDVFAD